MLTDASCTPWPTSSEKKIPTIRANSSGGAKKFYTLASLEIEVRETGKSLIVFQSKVYDISKWLAHHPGGQLAVTPLIGKDATEQILAFHPSFVYEKMMKRFQCGEMKYTEAEALQREDFIKVSASFDRLKAQIETEGLMETAPTFYGWLVLRFAVQFIASIVLCLSLPAPLNAVVGGFAVGFFWQQIAFFSHDAGHGGVTHNRSFDSLMGTVLATFFGGLSLGWWKHSHNVHHIITNHPEHDPDIQHMPVFAISKTFTSSLFSSYHNRVLHFDAWARWWVSMQHFTYLPLCTIGRFNLYFLSYNFLAEHFGSMDNGLLEVVGLATFWVWYGAVILSFRSAALGLTFLLVSHFVSSILHLQINVSHFGMSTEDIGCDEHFAVRALRTTCDVDCENMQWFHGGLQHQVIHHLFPRMPRPHLHKAVPLVKAFCLENGLVYHSHSFVKGNGLVLDRLREIALHVQFLVSTADTSHRH